MQYSSIKLNLGIFWLNQTQLNLADVNVANRFDTFGFEVTRSVTFGQNTIHNQASQRLKCIGLRHLNPFGIKLAVYSGVHPYVHKKSDFSQKGEEMKNLKRRFLSGRFWYQCDHLTNLMRKTYNFRMVGKCLYCAPKIRNTKRNWGKLLYQSV